MKNIGEGDDRARGLPRGKRLATADVPAKGVYALGWSPDGRLLAAGSADRRVRVWEA